MKTADSLILGSGICTRAGTAALMRPIMLSPLPKVVDADALKVLQNSKVSNAIFTPNEGEWRLLQQHNDVKKLLAKNTIIKKGTPTKILSDKRMLSVRPNKGLQKAGTGDILAGLCAGYLARGLSPLEAAKRACEIGNAIANSLREKNYDFIASDLAEERAWLSRGRSGKPAG